MNPSNLKIHNLSYCYNAYSYNEKLAFENINANFKHGERTAIMGPSGSGKTTLLYLIAGILQVQSGEIRYPFPKPVFSMVFQEDRLLEQETILTNLNLVQPELSEEHAAFMLERAGLSDYVIRTDYHVELSKKMICQLSGGEKRRIAIIRALLADYDILLMDEPFTGLDEATKLAMIELIKEQTAEKMVLWVTHSLAEAEALDSQIWNII